MGTEFLVITIKSDMKGTIRMILNKDWGLFFQEIIKLLIVERCIMDYRMEMDGCLD